LFILALNLTII